MRQTIARLACATMAVFMALASPAMAKAKPALVAPATVYMEELTWMEVRDRMNGGARVAIIPSGGTEQNGPHIIIGKHNRLVHYTAGQIAQRLGDALVAPVIAYVPEGRINPPEGHMQFPGTLSTRPESYAMVLEDAVRSLKQHGFTLIALIGDHGGTQDMQKSVAEKLNAEWKGSGVYVVHVADYYGRKNGQEKWAEDTNIGVKDPAAHAGLFDTSEMLAAFPAGVRADKRAAFTQDDYATQGASGDATKATENYGRRLLSLKIGAAIDQINAARKLR
jgi:creatinine amidohydrolase